MDQVEFANVIILNKTDLANEAQQKDIEEKIALLNPKAKVFKSIQSKVNVMDILNTSAYTDKEEFWVTSTKTEAAMEAYREAETQAGGRVPEACTARFDIKSFVYRARRPFHPGRLYDLWLEPFFANPPQDFEYDDDEEEEKTEDEKNMLEEEKKVRMDELQAEALEKQKVREGAIGELLRSKGFFWIATSNDITGGWQQAGNVLRIRGENPWMCLMPQFWEGTPSEPLVRADMNKPDGEEYEYKDRRQEIVFIGHGMKREVIQKLLDECLLNDDEMSLGPEIWKETWEDLDRIKLFLEDDDEDEEEEENRVECQDEDCPDLACKEDGS